MPRSDGTRDLSTASAFARLARCTAAERPFGSRCTTAYGVATGAPNNFADFRSTAIAAGWLGSSALLDVVGAVAIGGR